jgi:cation transport regulator ChaC
MDLEDLYFAYGADMDLPALKTRAGDVTVVSPARLTGYRMAFFGHNPIWDSGMETLVVDAQAETWGVLFRLRPAEWERLDACAGATLEGTGAYFHYPVEVHTPAGASLQARTYRKAVQGEPRLPSREYVAFLVAAACSRDLPPDYQARLRTLPSTPAAYPVPKTDPARRRHLHLL